MKKEIRIIGIDDAPFNKFKKGNVLVVGAVFRGGSFMEGVLSAKLKVDGSDSTAKLISMINKSKFKPQLRAIFLDGITFGGFNIVDIVKLNNATGIPVMTVIRRMPDIANIKRLLTRLNQQNKIKLIEKAGTVYKVNKLYVQLAGIDLDKARQMLKVACTRSFIPEPIRAAHMIASGIVNGESRGKA